MPSSSTSVLSTTNTLLYLDLTRDGVTQGASWVKTTQLPGVSTTLNTGVSPNVARECTLSLILDPDAPEKYYLSRRACLGIVNRANRRMKELPPMLKEALMEVINGVSEPTGSTE